MKFDLGGRTTSSQRKNQNQGQVSHCFGYVGLGCAVRAIYACTEYYASWDPTRPRAAPDNGARLFSVQNVDPKVFGGQLNPVG